MPEKLQEDIRTVKSSMCYHVLEHQVFSASQVVTLQFLLVMAHHLVNLLQGWGHEVICGDVDSAFASGECDHILEGEVKMGGQEHFYLEPQGNVIIPLENDEMCVISSTQVGTFSPTFPVISGVTAALFSLLPVPSMCKSPWNDPSSSAMSVRRGSPEQLIAKLRNLQNASTAIEPRVAVPTELQSDADQT